MRNQRLDDNYVSVPRAPTLERPPAHTTEAAMTSSRVLSFRPPIDVHSMVPYAAARESNRTLFLPGPEASIS
jgi:hypothetical protein